MIGFLLPAFLLNGTVQETQDCYREPTELTCNGPTRKHIEHSAKLALVSSGGPEPVNIALTAQAATVSGTGEVFRSAQRASRR